MTNKRPGAPAGNRNARKDAEPQTSFLYLRVTPTRKGAYVRAAQPGKLTDWATHHLDKAAGYKPEPKPQAPQPPPDAQTDRRSGPA